MNEVFSRSDDSMWDMASRVSWSSLACLFLISRGVKGVFRVDDGWMGVGKRGSGDFRRDFQIQRCGTSQIDRPESRHVHTEIEKRKWMSTNTTYLDKYKYECIIYNVYIYII